LDSLSCEIAIGIAERVMRVEVSPKRFIEYCVFGDPAGFPVFLCHGLPGSRLEGELWAQDAQATSTALVCMDRPGFGRSTFQAGRRLSDWFSDVVAVADQLGAGAFSVLGTSAGGPHALACGMDVHKRVRKIAVVSGIGPVKRETLVGMASELRQSLLVARVAPSLLRPLFAVTRRMVGTAAFHRRLASASPPADRVYLRDPDTMRVLAASMKEAFAAGTKGIAWEMRLLAQPWDFSLENITVPVEIWQGDADRNAPVAMAEYQASRIAGSVLHVLPGEGHLSAAKCSMRQILSSLRELS
jgi:pimeloyl-ACP methyl ester carboxylesterase